MKNVNNLFSTTPAIKAVSADVVALYNNADAALASDSRVYDLYNTVKHDQNAAALFCYGLKKAVRQVLVDSRDIIFPTLNLDNVNAVLLAIRQDFTDNYLAEKGLPSPAPFPDGTLPATVRGFKMGAGSPILEARPGAYVSRHDCGLQPLSKAFDNFMGLLAEAGSLVLGVETRHLFDNQFNTAPLPSISDSGFRMYEGATYHYPNPDYVTGYTVTLPAEYFALLNNTYACGYCAKQYAPGVEKPVFCTACRGSEYLTAADYPLLRLHPVSKRPKRSAPLTDVEFKALDASVRKARAVAAAARAAKDKEKLLQQLDAKVEQAKHERECATWLINKGADMGNILFYNHTNSFVWGWRRGLSDAERQEAAALCEGFPGVMEYK